MLVRYDELIPCKNAFVDSRSPGSDQKENFTIIGPGVSENPNQHVHIPVPHGFNIGGARQPVGCLNSQHSHLTAEVFIVHSGKWKFKWGVNGDDGSIEMGPGDTISLPTNMFRGFENIGNDTGFMFAVLGGDDPGRVIWAPAVFELAKEHGLVLLKGGKLIDTTQGEEVPADAELEHPPSEDELAQLKSPSNSDMAGVVVSFDSLTNTPSANLLLETKGSIEECPIITPQDTNDGFKSGPISGWWKHGFNLRCVKMDKGASIAKHTRAEEEVILMYKGELIINLSNNGGDGKEEQITLKSGDILTIPVSTERSWESNAADTAAFVVHGGDNPSAPQFS